MNIDDLKIVAENIEITEYLPKVPKCNICDGKNVEIRANHLYCKDCNQFNDFLKAIYYNNPEIKESKAFENSLLAKAKRRQDEKSFIDNIAPLQSKNIGIAEFEAALNATRNKTLTLINAPTGCGKTYTSVKHAIEEVKNGEKVAMACSTLEEVKRVVGIIKGYGFDDISIAISGLDTEPKKFKSIVVTTYAYLTSKGDSGEPYKIAKGILQDRVLICDEIQMIELYSSKIIPLCARYQPEGNMLTLREQCLHSIRKGLCDSCHLIIENYIDSKNKEYSLFPKLPLNEKYKKQIENPPVDKIFQPDFYTGVSINTLKTRKIKPDEKLFEQFPFIAENIGNFENLELRIQFTCIEEEGQKRFATREEILQPVEEIKDSRIKFPRYACGVPTLHCKSKMFYENAFSFTKKVIGMSATIPASVQSDFEEKAAEMGFAAELININKTPIKYNVTALKLARKLSHSDLAAILKTFDTPTFLVEAKMREAKLQYEELTKDSELAKRVVFFKQGDYIGIRDNLDCEAKVENAAGTIRVTYANSAISRAKDMPDINLVIVDCSQFLPTLALDYKNDVVDELEMRDIQAKNISDKLHQIIGRVFRSNLDYNPGITQVDGRQIVILLHNLPYELQEFTPDLKILNFYQEFRNEHVTGLQDKQRKDCVAASIQEGLNGQSITNKGLEQKYKTMLEVVKAGGVSKLKLRQDRGPLDKEELEFVKRIKRDENSYIEILSYFAKRYDYTPSNKGEDG